MKFILITLLSLSFTKFASATENSIFDLNDKSLFYYDFPGCSPGSGNWPARQMVLENNICDNKRTTYLTEAGNCNGYLTLKVNCDNGQIVDVNVQDCFCD